MVETEARGKSECTNLQIQGVKLSPSSTKSNPQNSSFESSESLEVSLTDTDQSMIYQINQSRGTPKCNLPKVLFAEWWSLDQFHGQNSGTSSSGSDDFKSALDPNSEESLVPDLLHNEGAFGKELQNSNTISVDDMLTSPFRFEDHITESGLFDYLTGEFDINCDDMYL